MQSQAAADITPPGRNWSPSNPAVLKAYTYMQKHREHLTPSDLVEWDYRHGQQLFNWDDPSAAAEQRLYQARVFINTFRGVIDGVRVRSFISVPAPEADTSGDTRFYVSTEIITQDLNMRQLCIDQLMRKIKRQLSEVKFWKLSDTERDDILAQLRAAITD